jgi:hypothetical protein
MKATGKLHDLGRSLWLDNITRGLLDSGALTRASIAIVNTGRQLVAYIAHRRR